MPLSTHAQSAAPKNYLRGAVHAHWAKQLPHAARKQLTRQGSVVVQGREGHFFALYERNAYDGLPSFVTLDTVLHVFHRRFDDALADLEIAVAIPTIQDFANRQSKRARDLLQGQAPPTPRTRFLAGYHAVARALLDPDNAVFVADPLHLPGLDPQLRQQVTAEVTRIVDAAGHGPSPWCPRGMDYTMFQPRGHYDRPHLLGYFRAMMFFAQCALDLEDPEQLQRALDLVRLADTPSRTALSQVRELSQWVSGPSEDPGLPELAALLPRSAPPLPQPLPQSTIAAIRDHLARRPLPTIPDQAAPGERPTRLFRLLGQGAAPDSTLLAQTADWSAGRPIPSGLDVLATLGSADARRLLAPQVQRMPHLARALRTKLPGPGKSFYHRWLAVLGLTVRAPGPDHPYFEQTPAWARHLTVAAAGSWAELKHDSLLYAKQPLVWAQGGHEAELPAAKAGGYVEPRPEVYRALLELTRDLAAQRPPPRHQQSLDELRELLSFLLDVSLLELSSQPIPPAVDRRLRGIGHDLEQLSLGHGDALPDQAVVADVFTTRDPHGPARVLQVGIGDVDEIYVLAPRGQRLVLMRGGVFSYYEQEGAPDKRLSDREWLAILRGPHPPKRPIWAQPIPTPLRQPRRRFRD